MMEELGGFQDGLWIVPMPLARDQVTYELALRLEHGLPSRVFCWEDLWRWVYHESDDGPEWLSETASRAVLEDALAQASQRGLIRPLERFIGLPGYQRRLRARFDEWTGIEPVPRNSAIGDLGDSIDRAEQTVFAEYRKSLRRLRVEDAAGARVWASKRLTTTTRLWNRLEGDGPIVVLLPETPGPTHWRVLGRAACSDRDCHVGLINDTSPELAAVYLAAELTRSRFVEYGFEEIRFDPLPARPSGLARIERAVFSPARDGHSPIEDVHGLRIEGAPQAEGTSRIICREVRRLRERGVAPEDILILFRQWNTEAELALERMRAWGIPVHGDVGEPLYCAPAACALRLAATIPLEEWETELIVRLLRHGQLRPSWPGVDALRLASAAATIRSTKVFRRRESLLRGLDRILASNPAQSLETREASSARQVAERLFAVLAEVDAPRPWRAQAGELRRIASELGIDGGPVPVLEPLWEALDDQAEVLSKLGRDERAWTWHSFIAEVQAILRQLGPTPHERAPGSIRITTVPEAEGAIADHVILADLIEGSFPARSAVRPFLDLRPGDEPSLEHRAHFGREMARFLDVLGSARAEILLVYPTTDPKGQELLRAGFLDDIMAIVRPDLLGGCHRSITRLHPALLDEPDLVGTPCEHRVRAVALASERGETGPLRRLAAIPEHQPILKGVAAALVAHQNRLRGAPFGEYDGLIHDGAAILEIDRAFGPNFRFSPSQLETYLACPFQFFSKYVLKLKVREEHDELEEDLTERGSQLHDILDNFEKLALQMTTTHTLEELKEIQLRQLAEREPAGATELDLGLWEIERERLARVFGQYLIQRQDYHRDGDLPFVPAKLELDFGGDGAIEPVLKLDNRGRQVLIRGRIDRIDVAATPDGLRFRIIDYKSGSAPTALEVKQGAMLQLPLYAMAVQQFLFRGENAELFDLGYWSLKGGGFKPIAFSAWEQDQRSLMEHVLAMVDQLRRGEFVIQSRKVNCENYCEFRGVCRVRQVRRAGKRHEIRLAELSASSPRRRRARVSEDSGTPGASI